MLIQGLAFGVALAAFDVSRRIGLHLPSFAFFIFQGVLAAEMSRRLRLAPWWPWIQLLFSIALWAVPLLRLPPAFFLIGFGLFAALFWNIFRTQVPFYPSPKAVWKTVVELLPKDRTLAVADLGSGFGGLVCHLAASRPDIRVTGIESAPLPWLVSRLRKKGRRPNCRFIRADYAGDDLAAYDVVFVYLSGAAMPALWQQAISEMRPRTLLLSYEFAIPGVAPSFVAQPDTSGRALYGWRM
ncbi:MAG: class I SAM-dependent methyltransferase [Burkholderiaceae bacterium]